MAETRSEVIENALKEYRESGQKRTQRIEFRGVAKELEVITLNPSIPLLRRENSRLRAQLLSHPKKSLVDEDPYSEEAQEVLAQLLRGTERFKELKKNLGDYNQAEPGIIARDGRLVNGNTRLTAIRDMGVNRFDVAVLPSDANDEDFFEIEMSLQLRPTVHQDYTFTNQLLLIEATYERTRNDELTFQYLQWKRDGAKRLKKSLGYLEIIKDVRKLNPSLSYAFFDSKQELIKNLYEGYSSLLKDSAAEAEKFKQTRILGVLMGLNKDEVRAMDEDFFEDEVIPGFGEDELDGYLTSSVSPVGEQDPLDQLVGTEQNSVTVNFDKLLNDVASQVIGEDGLVDDGLIEENFKPLYNTMRSSARRIIEDRVAAEMRAEPIEYLNDVTKKVQDLAERIPELFSDANFDDAKFKYQARQTQQALQALSKALNDAS